MADRSPKLYSPDRMQAAETVARALKVVAAADSPTVKSLDAALMAIAEATATTSNVSTAGIGVHHRPAEKHEESASAMLSMHASVAGDQSLQSLLYRGNRVGGSLGSLTRLRHPPSSPRNPAGTAGVAAEDTIGMIATTSTPALLPTDKLTSMHRAAATQEQLIHTLDAVRPACTGGRFSQVQGGHLPGCLGTPQVLKQQSYLLHGCKQEMQHAIQRSKVLGTISHADRASSRQLNSSTTTVSQRAIGDAPEPQLDVLQHDMSSSSSRSNSDPLVAPRRVHSNRSSRGHQAGGFGSLMGQPQAAAAVPNVPMPAQNSIIQVVSGVRDVVNSSPGKPLYATAQQPLLKSVGHETSLNGWLAGQRH